MGSTPSRDNRKLLSQIKDWAAFSLDFLIFAVWELKTSLFIGAIAFLFIHTSAIPDAASNLGWMGAVLIVCAIIDAYFTGWALKENWKKFLSKRFNVEVEE